MILEKFYAEPITLDRAWEYKHPRGFGKPKGIWVSVKGEDDWPEWSEGEQWNWPENFDHRHEVTLHEDSNILFIENLKELKAFNKKYGAPMYPEDPVIDRYTKIDWDKVQSLYDGIIITPYQWPARFGADTFWYYGWDCASGCIWNLDVIDLEWKEQRWAERRHLIPELAELAHRLDRYAAVALEQAQNMADYGVTDPTGGRGRQQYSITHPLFPKREPI